MCDNENFPDGRYRDDSRHVYEIHGYSEQGTWHGKGFYQEGTNTKYFARPHDLDSNVTAIEEFYDLSKMMLANIEEIS